MGLRRPRFCARRFLEQQTALASFGEPRQEQTVETQRETGVSPRQSARQPELAYLWIRRACCVGVHESVSLPHKEVKAK